MVAKDQRAYVDLLAQRLALHGVLVTPVLEEAIEPLFDGHRDQPHIAALP